MPPFGSMIPLLRSAYARAEQHKATCTNCECTPQVLILHPHLLRQLVHEIDALTLREESGHARSDI